MPPVLPANRNVTVWTVATDGSLWYAFDEPLIGSSDLPNLGLYRLKDGQISHYKIEDPIRVLKAAADGSLYIGTGCGVLRYRLEKWDTLANPDCRHSTFAELLIPVDMAFTDNGDVWVAGVWSVTQYSDETWTQHDINATRLFVAPDGSLWAEGWDGRANSHCCFAHLANNTWMTYTLSAAVPSAVEIRP